LYALDDDAPMLFPPDGLVMVEDETKFVDENSLVLIWDTTVSELTVATLCRPSLAEFPGQSLNVLTSVVIEDDLEGFERTDTDERRTGTRACGRDGRAGGVQVSLRSRVRTTRAPTRG
jgi:hypothetical protein